MRRISQAAGAGRIGTLSMIVVDAASVARGVIHHDHGAMGFPGSWRPGFRGFAGVSPEGYAIAGFGAAALSGAARTAASISCSVGRLTRKISTSAAIAPSAAPKKKPYTQW